MTSFSSSNNIKLNSKTEQFIWTTLTQFNSFKMQQTSWRYDVLFYRFIFFLLVFSFADVKQLKWKWWIDNNEWTIFRAHFSHMRPFSLTSIRIKRLSLKSSLKSSFITFRTILFCVLFCFCFCEGQREKQMKRK